LKFFENSEAVVSSSFGEECPFDAPHSFLRQLYSSLLCFRQRFSKILKISEEEVKAHPACFLSVNDLCFPVFYFNFNLQARLTP
jgi:hypothetical protein